MVRWSFMNVIDLNEYALYDIFGRPIGSKDIVRKYDVASNDVAFTQRHVVEGTWQDYLSQNGFYWGSNRYGADLLVFS